MGEYSSYSQVQAPDSDIQALVRLYLVSLNTMYGFVDQAQTATDLEAYQALRQQPNFSPDALHGDQAHRYFRITMMCAISCANQARYRPYRAAECFAYYAGAVACVEEVTSEASPASLQALLLLIVFYLFHPRRGDIWKLLDYACRLTIELGYHTEAEHDQTTIGTARGEPEPEPAESQRKLRRSTFWGLYAIERIVGQLFGRGSDLPETMITTEYPSSLDTAIPSPGGGDRPGTSGTDMSSVDQATLQSMSIAHHYRLVYLRSEIFRTLYLPASPPDLGPEWLKDRYMTLHAWRRELEVSDELTGVATVTCDVGYDATICFLFQPMLLKALRATATAPPASSPPAPDTRNAARASDADADEILVGSDPFYSAVNLIRTYEKIIRAPERSVLGTYPMTFMSAHYIYLASSTVLAYALLRLEGRIKVLKRIRDSDGDRAASKPPAAAEAEAEHDTEEIDWGVFVDVSISCLILLSWCGERWPGMIGMLETYQELFRKTAKDLIRNGIVR